MQIAAVDPMPGVEAVFLWPGADLGGSIRRVREDRGMSQTELGVRVGRQLGRPPFRREAVGHWERGRREPDMGTLMAIGVALGVAFVLGGSRLAEQVARRAPLVLDVAATMAELKAAKQRGKGQTANDP